MNFAVCLITMDTVFKTFHFNIDATIGEDTYLIPFGDVHRDTPSCDVDRWNWFRENCKKYPKDKTWYLGMGDFNDFASSREQKILADPKLHDETKKKLDSIIERDNRRFANEISFMRGRLIGVLDGNHNWVFRDGTTATQDLCERMNAPYLGWLSWVELRIKLLYKTGKEKSKGTTDIRIFIVACHGKAGGKLMGTSINQVDDLVKIFPVADIYIQGHDHQRYAVPKSILIPGVNGAEIKQKRQFLARSGSFKKGYCEGVSGYEVGRLLRPSDLGAVVFEISVHRDLRDTDRLILDISAII